MKLLGKQVKGKWVAAGGAGALGLFLVYRHFAGGSAGAAAGTSGSAIDPLTGLPASQDSQVDPATGMTYLQEAQQYGSVAAAEAAVSGQYGAAGGYGYYGGTSGYPTTGTTTGTSTPPQTYASDAQWAQAVQAGLIQLGYSGTDVAAALGLYFQNLPEDATQVTIMQTAVAEYGPPPVGTYSIIGGGGGGGTPPPVTWKTVTAPGGRTLAQLAEDSDKSVPWAEVIARNSWALRFEGKPIPAGYKVVLPFAATTSTT
jgi:hypothetical protein